MVPSEAIEVRIRVELERAGHIFNQLQRDNLFIDPYVVSTVYFHDGFLRSFPRDKPNLDPSLRIGAYLADWLPADRKPKYVALLRDAYEQDVALLEPPDLTAPVPYSEEATKPSRQSHQDAIDLFVPEGTPVLAAWRGVVVLSERGWEPHDPFSTSSQRGGNTVIIFDPERARFYRYAHLDTTLVAAGDLVQAGQQIGVVGHSGANAAKPHHGGHLHFEINQFDGQQVSALSRVELLALLQQSQRLAKGMILSTPPALPPVAPEAGYLIFSSFSTLPSRM